MHLLIDATAVMSSEFSSILIEVTPEKYAAFSIKDMSTASAEKKQMFAEYANQLIRKKAKVDFYLNEIPVDIINPESWPSEWHSYRLRVSRSPICSENEVFDEANIVSSWASIIVGMFLSLLNVTNIEEEEHYEGGVKKVSTNRYERNPVNRELCLAANGYVCKICGFDFEKVYGQLGYHFIHVHHIVPISKMVNTYVLGKRQITCTCIKEAISARLGLLNSKC